MSTIRQEISNIRSIFKWMNKDTKITDRFLASKLKSIGLKFIKQATDKRKLWNSVNIFTPLPCLPMEMVSLSECCDYEGDCKIARSVDPIPRVAEGTNFGMLIDGIYSIDGISRKFIESSPTRFANSLDLGLKTNKVHYWIQNVKGQYHLYISDPLIDKIRFVAYFEDDVPLSLLYCSDAPCCPNNPLDEEYKVPGYMSDDVQKELEKQLAIFKNSLEDKQANSLDETK